MTLEQVDASANTILRTVGLRKEFELGRRSLSSKRRRLVAVNDVSLSLDANETLGIVGESGSGKSTLGRLIARLLPIDQGTITFGGIDITSLEGRELRQIRRHIQMIFQDPYGALDPTKRASHAIGEPLLVHQLARRSAIGALAEDLAEKVALDPKLVHRYPDQLSGGQRQRILIARALALEPKLIVADEPTSALDLSTRSEILNLLLDLQQRDGLALILISHDFTTVRHLSHHIAVMYLGRIIEYGPAELIANEPKHPYTQALLSSVPVADPRVERSRARIELTGPMPSPAELPSGCAFRTRCPHAMTICSEVTPVPSRVDDGRTVACHLVSST
ncbi:ABC transporter ATP-binding protein [Ilumatobacter coccineus]|uniref:Oligopeptide ABC transporter ATP-binding protein n=1 Tax=Ilumatobacter coccineus (strain NBRC 103263 / KCTC 29153 / YM16-304) TaxID=1313172 RepID=A0A6C7E6P5_ILUCY|nr:ABC transporter ATP-binding protein [Ilumatobacter coccineus]BAN02073.1 oligopeptide ABC transporter ATP-binding protein [Ilumatobacter coccineus YM16-304]